MISTAFSYLFDGVCGGKTDDNAGLSHNLLLRLPQKPRAADKPISAAGSKRQNSTDLPRHHVDPLVDEKKETMEESPILLTLHFSLIYIPVFSFMQHLVPATYMYLNANISHRM